jgi:hypothetical protein
MRKVVLAKFEQHQKLRDLLLSTKDSTLVEHTSNDNYWGDGGNGSGLNMLGKILMEVRTKLAIEDLQQPAFEQVGASKIEIVTNVPKGGVLFKKTPERHPELGYDVYFRINA